MGNGCQLVSTALFFTILISAMSVTLPSALKKGLAEADVPAAVAAEIATIPPATAVVSAELGASPIDRLLADSELGQGGEAVGLPPEGDRPFAQLIAEPFSEAMRLAFVVAAIMAILGAFVSAKRGPRVVPERVAAASADQPAG